MTTSVQPRAGPSLHVPKSLTSPDSDIRDLPAQAALHRARAHDRITSY